MIRINTEDKWELLIGVPREGFTAGLTPDSDGYVEDASGNYDHMICHQDNYDATNGICYPTSQRGPGFADAVTVAKSSQTVDDYKHTNYSGNLV